jgi:hypothetical protein
MMIQVLEHDVAQVYLPDFLERFDCLVLYKVLPNNISLFTSPK